MEFVGVPGAQSGGPSNGSARDLGLAPFDARGGGSAPAAHRLKTYLVEDSPIIRENLIATLEELSPVRVVGSAEDESSAVRWLGSAGPGVDLVIVDIFLKSGSGLGVLRAVQVMPDLACKRVVLSNYATPDVRRKCLELGADQVFDKSHDIEALIRYCTRLAQGGDAGSGAPA
jgi:DNA-binding NarL/FixJ family response regulator